MSSNRKPEIGDVLVTRLDSFPMRPQWNGKTVQVIAIRDNGFFSVKKLRTGEIFLITENEIDWYEEKYIMENNLKVVRAKIDGVEMNFTTYEECNVGDYVVVKSDHTDFALTQVTKAKNVRGSVEFNAEVVCKVDMSTYNKRKERAKRRAELKDMMDSAVKDFKDMTMYEMIAAKNPEFAKLLEEFKELG